MAFDTQIQDLIGTFTDQAAMDTWMGDGAKEIINVMPDGLRALCASEATFTSGTPNTLNTGKVLFITRNDGTIDQPCRKIPALLAGRAADTVDMQYASATDPAFFIKNNTIDVLPASGACKYSEVQYPTVDASADSAIAVFPDEAEYLVVLYASIKALQQNMAALEAGIPVNSDQDGSYSASSSSSQGWEKVRDWFESDEDVEMASATMNALTAEMNQTVAEYSWYEKQQQKLQADYDKGLKLLMGGE